MDRLKSSLLRDGIAVLAASLTVVLIVVPRVVGTGISDSAVSCGGGRNAVQAEFDLAHAKDMWQVFPAMLRAPELESSNLSAHVVVFSGDVDLSGMIANGAATDAKVQDAVCVVLEDGTHYFYDGVSRAGARIP